MLRSTLVRRLAPLLGAAFVLARPAPAADTWTTPEPGLRRLHRTAPGPVELDAVFVDVCDPSLDLRATRSSERQQTTSAWGRAVGARAAINGDFFSFGSYTPVGLAVGTGERWSDTADGPGEAVFAAGLGGRVELRPTAEALGGPETWMREVVSGRPNCLVGGVARVDTDSHFGQRHPRTAVGLTRDRQTVILLAIDGRTTRSIGATTYEVGEMLRDLGAWDGLNLDGGGSTTLWLANGGVANRPSDGSERVVANHLGVLRTTVPAGEPSRCCNPRTVADAAGYFQDVSATHYARESIEALRAAGAANGCSTTPPYYCPGCRADRATVVATLVRALRRPLMPPARPTFSDVPTSHPLYAEIERAAADGITSGCGGGRFCPDDPVSRGTLAILAARAIGASTAPPAMAPFSDVPVTHQAAGAIASLVARCVVGGCGAGQFCVTRTATRAEVAIVVARATRLLPVSCGTDDAGVPPDASMEMDSGPGPDATVEEDAGGEFDVPGTDASEDVLVEPGPEADAGIGSDAGGDAAQPGEVTGGCGCRIERTAHGAGASAGRALALMALALAFGLSRRRSR